MFYDEEDTFLQEMEKKYGVSEKVLKEREPDYTHFESFRISIGTWNVNGQDATEPLSDWLKMSDDPPDIYAIGFQELDLKKEVLLWNETDREEKWRQKVEDYLHVHGKYQKEDHKNFVREVRCDTVKTGIMGTMGNKGGVAVRFMFHNTSFCFVNCHLAAHMEECDKRNQHYQDIHEGMKFNNDNGTTYPIDEHDFVFWMGDLNYRISGLQLDRVTDCIKEGKFDFLLQYDQLKAQVKEKKVFLKYHEGSIGFRPTYKFHVGSNEYDTRAENMALEKQRIPAWCDRILYLGPVEQQLFYTSHDSFLLSDHKPVSSLLKVGIKVVNQEKFRKVLVEELQVVDQRENDALPQLLIKPNELRIGNISFMEKKEFTVFVANVGKVEASFSFFKEEGANTYCKPWMQIQPPEGSIKVGGLEEIKIFVEVTKQTACFLNSAQERLDDILILRLDNGKDYYITVNGTYQPSCFGASIETLVRIAKPIGQMEIEEIIRMELTDWSEESEAENSTEKINIPREIAIMVESLCTNGLETKELFSKEVGKEELIVIRKVLDIGISEKETMPGSIYSIAKALMIFLECLKEPVIPYEIYNKCLEASNNYTLCKQVVKKLPRSHRNVFKYIVTFIRKLLQHKDVNKLDENTLCKLFGEVFLRTPPSERENESQLSASTRKTMGQQRKNFVYHFIINEYDE